MDNQKKGYDPLTRERYWQSFWDDEKIYEFDLLSSKPLFPIDTPPPTISGALHLGHVFSYTQAEAVARFKRMQGFNIRFPFGLDDNGLPTERLVEKERGIRGKDVSLDEFVKICLDVTGKYKKEFESLWKSLGFSYDWRLEYTTISPEVQKMSQGVFLELFNDKKIYRQESSSLYCVECQTSVAQAEVEDSERQSAFYDIAFASKENGELVISTTRPELLPACVAVFCHPEDKRYTKFVGKTVTTPLGDQITVIADKNVLKDKGTGAVMCCTYGDETDVKWVREYNLPEKIIIDKAGKIHGKTIREARSEIIERIKKENALRKEIAITHDVGVHERCGTPIEILPTTQWFVKILDMKQELIEAGDKINWYPTYMQKRYQTWVNGLKWDWCISRERFFGIPIPAFICEKCSEIVLADKSKLPIDPKVFEIDDICPKCGGVLIPERDVLDTWFTSSLTPDINNDNPLNGRLRGKILPMSLRPQAHDIIRTWAVYTILMNLYRHHDIPWKDLMISGHILLRKGEKISKKTGGGKYKPEEMIREHSADAIRYVMCGAGLGKDGFYDENEVNNGKRLVNKLYNACKFVLSVLKNYEHQRTSPKDLLLLDKWIVSRMRMTSLDMQKSFEKYEFGLALQVFEKFFWCDFADNYLEIVKGRIYDGNEGEKRSAQWALYETFWGILKMASPFLPHITEELYHTELESNSVNSFTESVSEANKGFFYLNEKIKSIHSSDWPIKLLVKNDLDTQKAVDLLLKAVTEMRRYKSSNQIRLGQEMGRILIGGNKNELELFTTVKQDLRNVSRSTEVVLSNSLSNDQEFVLKIMLSKNEDSTL